MATNDQLKPEDGKTPLAETFAAGGVEEQGTAPPMTPEEERLADVFFESLAGRDPNAQTPDEVKEADFGSMMRTAIKNYAAKTKPLNPEEKEAMLERIRAETPVEGFNPKQP